MKKITSRTKLLTYTSVMIALTTIFTAYIFHIPVGLNGGYIHFGDTVIYLAAAILPTPYAMLVGALGGGIADLLTAPMWTLPTIIIKMLIVLPFSSGNSALLSKRNMVAPCISFFISATGYYLAGRIFFGSETALLTSMSGSLVQSGGSALFFYMIAAAFDRSAVKKTILTSEK